MKTSLRNIYGNLTDIKPTEPLRRCFDGGILPYDIWSKEFDIQVFDIQEIIKLQSFSGYNIIKQFNEYATEENYDTVINIAESGKIINPIIILKDYVVLDGYHRVIAVCDSCQTIKYIRLISY